MAGGRSPLVLPGGMEVNMANPSPDAQLLAGGLQEIVYLLGGNPNTNQPGVIQMLQGVQMQLDTLIRMEANETSKNEIKRRIQKADYAAEREMREREEAQEQALITMEKEAAKNAEAVDPLDEPADPSEGEHDIGGEG